MKDLTLGQRIAHYRLKCNIKQKELAAQVGLTPTALNYYEKDKRAPGIETVIKLAAALNISSAQLIGSTEKASGEVQGISTQGLLIAKKYDAANSSIKYAINKLLDLDTHAEEAYTPKIITLPFPLNAASAGFGHYLVDNEVEDLAVYENELTLKADMCLKVSGNSMEPSFYDGDIVLVHKQQDIRNGEIGIFLVGPEGYIKEKGPSGLISHNSQYPLIKPGDCEAIICIGKVIGKLKADWLAD